jgi:hypothetical protein
MRIAAMPSNVKSAATILSESEDQHRAGLLSHWDDDSGTNPPLSVDRNPADLARAGDDSGPELRSFGRRRTDRGARTQSNRVTPHTCLALAGRPKPGLQGPRALVVFLFAGLLTAFGDAVTGLILLDNSWLQSLIAVHSE